MPTMPTLVFSAAGLRQQRQRSGVSRDQLAIRIGRTVSTVSKYELGMMRPSVDILGAIAVELGCQVDALYAADAGRGGAE